MHSQFLEAILAEPAADAPRLVYADWLEEHGDADRAEFIRIQIEHFHAPQPHLEKRSQELLATHKHEWEIPGIRGVQRFRRGFVERLETAAANFLAHAERIGASAPVVDLRLPLALWHMDALAKVPWLSRVQRLDLTGNVGLGGLLGDMVDRFRHGEGRTLPARLVGTFFDSSVLGQLRSLVLRNSQFWPSDSATLAGIIATLPKLESLNLSGNPIGDAGLEALAASPSFATLTELILRADGIPEIDRISGLGAAALARSPHLSKLESLDLSGHNLNDAGFIELAESPTLNALTTLDVSHNDIGLMGPLPYERLAQSLQLPAIKQLVLDGNRIDVASAVALTQMPRLPRMEAISVVDCFADDLATAVLAAAGSRASCFKLA
jgi:uncharacterized protein (TIGR02996 family)